MKISTLFTVKSLSPWFGRTLQSFCRVFDRCNRVVLEIWRSTQLTTSNQMHGHALIIRNKTFMDILINYWLAMLLSSETIWLSELHETFLLNHVKCSRIVYARKVHMPLCNYVNRIWRQTADAWKARNNTYKSFPPQDFPNNKKKRDKHIQRQRIRQTYRGIHDFIGLQNLFKKRQTKYFFHCITSYK